jgi:hypothetical protein
MTTADSIRKHKEASGLEIDAYATHILRSMSPPDALIDTSVGPYVTALLRCADITDTNHLTKLVEYESLLELLEDQCSMDQQTAITALEAIAEAVTTQILPLDQSNHAGGMDGTTNTSTAATKTTTTTRNTRQGNIGPYSGGGLDSFQSLRSTLPGSSDDGSNVRTNRSSLLLSTEGLLSEQSGGSSTTIEPYTPGSVGGPSPLRPDNLIPFDLLGALDDPSPYQQRCESQSQAVPDDLPVQFSSPPNPAQHHHYDFPPGLQVSDSNRQQRENQQRQEEDFPPLGRSVDSFPPLRASTTDKPKKSKVGSSRKAVSGKTHQHSDKDLAAALFRPARARQNSIENEDVTSGTAHSSITRPRGQSFGSGSTTGSGSAYEANSGQQQQQQQQQQQSNMYYQQQLSSCVEILLSMNQDLSEDAATQAALLADTDFNVAHFMVDAAMMAPPICRHLLHEGCYRSDCQFSHDIEGHTCLFWIRGRCGKGSTCRFLHGFNKKLLNEIRLVRNNNDNNVVSSSVRSTSEQQYQHLQDRYNETGEAVAIYGSNEHDTSISTTYPGYAYSASSGVHNIVGDYGTIPPGLTQSWQQIPSAADTSSVSNSYPSSGDFPSSFANVASKGSVMSPPPTNVRHLNNTTRNSSTNTTVRIPQDLWNPHENRDSSVFFVADPLERYTKVAATVGRRDVIDLHFQSMNTFGVVLTSILPSKLSEWDEIWIVTGTGHHVGKKTHQKGGGALEGAVIQWLADEGYNFFRGKDRNGLGGALLVKR